MQIQWKVNRLGRAIWDASGSARDGADDRLTLRQGMHAGKGGFSVSRHQGKGRNWYRWSGAFTKATRPQEPRHDRTLCEGSDGERVKPLR